MRPYMWGLDIHVSFQRSKWFDGLVRDMWIVDNINMSLQHQLEDIHTGYIFDMVDYYTLYMSE